MVKKTTSNKAGVKPTAVRGELWNASPTDENDVLPDRILGGIETLAAASKVEPPDGKFPRARIVWYALAAYLADNGVLEHLNAAAACMANAGGKPPSERLPSAVSMGEAMHLFFDGADERDFALKNRLVEAMMGATENLDDRITGKHWGMVLTDLARIAYLAETTENPS
jgi:hypothetical protein